MIDRRWSCRHLLQLAAASLAAAALIACTFPPLPLEETQMASVPHPPVANGPTLTRWQPFSNGHRAAVESLNERFEEEKSGQTKDVQPVSRSADWDHLTAAAAAADPPDTYRIPKGQSRHYIASGHILPVNDLLPSSADIEETYLPRTAQRAKRNDWWYGLPVDVQNLAVFRYNAINSVAGLETADAEKETSRASLSDANTVSIVASHTTPGVLFETALFQSDWPNCGQICKYAFAAGKRSIA